MMIDRGAIDAQLREIGEGDRWWEQREFRHLPHVLHLDERIRGLTLGKLRDRRPLRITPAAPWLFVATDQRLICLQQKRFARSQIDIVAGQVTAVRQSTGLRHYRLTLLTPSRQYRLRLPKADAFRFLAALAPLVPQPTATPLPPDLEPLSLIPGFRTITTLPAVSGLVAKVSMLSPPDYATRGHVSRLETDVERLQVELEQTRQQVAFLQELLERRSEHAALPGSEAHG